jgi:hypothetical protein
MKKRFSIRVLRDPRRRLGNRKGLELIDELRTVAATCFDPVPNYQALVRRPEALDGKLVALARDRSGRLVGFMSAVLIQADGVGEVLHTGLTCVAPSARSAGLTHRLSRALLLSHLAHVGLFSTVWVSNVACVLSSLGNIALHFDDVFPSPFGEERPAAEHLAVARAINRRHREDIAINAGARFDPHAFVFRGSVDGTSFCKDEDDARFHHRDDTLNAFYTDRMDFAGGDEVLQVGRFSLLTFASYLAGRKRQVTHREAA